MRRAELGLPWVNEVTKAISPGVQTAGILSSLRLRAAGANSTLFFGCKQVHSLHQFFRTASWHFQPSVRVLERLASVWRIKLQYSCCWTMFPHKPQHMSFHFRRNALSDDGHVEFVLIADGLGLA